MHLRPYTRSEIPACADIFAAAFRDDEFFAHLAPRKDAYPNAWRRWAVEKQYAEMWRRGSWGVVCVGDAADGAAADGQILGYAWWRRHASASAREPDIWTQNNTSLAAALERCLRGVEARYADTVRAYPCVSREAAAEYAAAVAAFDIWAKLKGVRRWHLAALAVAPAHQRKGVGEMLLHWGLERAREESAALEGSEPPVPVTLVASGPGQGLYTKNGFRVVGWKNAVVSLLGFGSVSGRAMIWDPDGYWVREAEPGTLVEGKEVEMVWTDNVRRGT